MCSRFQVVVAVQWSSLVSFSSFFLILRGILALQEDATMPVRNAGQRTLGGGGQYPAKLNISNHRRNLGGGIKGGKCPSNIFST